MGKQGVFLLPPGWDVSPSQVYPSGAVYPMSDGACLASYISCFPDSGPVVDYSKNHYLVIMYYNAMG